MKIFTLSLLFVFTASMAMAQDSIPNGGFERWTYTPVPSYWDADGWRSANPYSSAGGAVSTTLDSVDVHSGKYSAKLTTHQIGSNVVPGLVSTGYIDVNTFSMIGGIPIHSRPVLLQGWYKYIPQNDTAGISFELLNADSAIVGSGSLDISDSVTEWTFFTVPVIYVSDSVPTLSQVIITSSNHHGAVGSEMHVDDVSYSYYPAGIKETDNKTIAVFPNPANNQFAIDNSEIHAKTLSLYAIDGKLLTTYSLHDGFNTLDVSNISGGIYIIHAIGNTGATYTNSLVLTK